MIQHPTKGLIPFNTFVFQDDCVKDFNEHRFNIIVKARQLGLSTLVAAYAVWLAIFYRDKNILIIATKLSVAQNFIKKVKVMIKSLPPWLVMPELTGSSKQHVEFSNGSQVKAVPTSDDAGRSEALSLLIVDEAAFIRNFDDLWMGLYSTVSTGGRAIVLSTPNGTGGQYYDLYTQAEEGINDFHPIKLMWNVHPERDQVWFDKETKNMTTKQIAQELMCDFASSADNFLNQQALSRFAMQIENPIEKWGPKSNIWTWKYPQADHNYIVSADIARGDAFDYSAFHVFDTNTSEQVAEFKGKLPPDQFGSLLAEVGKKYNNAIVCPEDNTYGYTTIAKLIDEGYTNLYFKKEKNKLATMHGIPVEIGMIGFHTNASTRSAIIAKFESVARNGTVRFRSSRLYTELKTFIWIKDKARAMKGKHDDLVMAAAIGTFLFDPNGEPQHAEIDKSYKGMLAGFGVNKADDSDKDIAHHRSKIDPFKPMDSKHYFEDEEQLKWLLQ